MNATAGSSITLLELVEAISHKGLSETEIVRQVRVMVKSQRVHLIGEFLDRHVTTDRHENEVA